MMTEISFYCKALCLSFIFLPELLFSQEVKSISIGDSLHLAARVIYEDNFNSDLQWWKPEQQPNGTVTIENGKLEIIDSGGCTLWFTNKLIQPLMIEYTVIVIDEGGPHDQVTDLNCFWLATDSRQQDLLENTNRNGKFTQYDSLQLYYVGLGGHRNTKTRFRRYRGDGTKPLLPEHDLADPRYLITPNEQNRIRIIAYHGIIQYWRNDQLIFDFFDESPYTSGYFAFRTVHNHMTVDDFKVYTLR